MIGRVEGHVLVAFRDVMDQDRFGNSASAIGQVQLHLGVAQGFADLGKGSYRSGGLRRRSRGGNRWSNGGGNRWGRRRS